MTTTHDIAETRVANAIARIDADTDAMAQGLDRLADGIARLKADREALRLMCMRAALGLRSLQWLNGELGDVARERCAALADDIDALVKRVGDTK